MNADFSYDQYSALLSDYVNDQGMVDYAGLKSDRSDLDAFIVSMGTLHPDTFSQWTENEQLAFWINAYNAITLQFVINVYPIEKGSLLNRALYPDNSIRQIDGVWTELTASIMGERLTLDHIEHKILRKEFSEPRIHMAIVCAAKSCPPLRAEAFEPDKLETQLAEESTKFFANKNRFFVDERNGKVHISSILDWFGKDFVPLYNQQKEYSNFNRTEGAVLDFISQHIDKKYGAYLKNQSYKISYLDYDWSLNDQ